MKIKYLGTLFAASVLSLGLITSCDTTTPEAGETEVEPDAGVVDPVEPGLEEPGLEEVDPETD